MEREFASYLRLQEKRVALLRDLCSSFRESHRAIAELNLDAIYRTTLEQEAICSRIRSVDEDLKTAQRAFASSLRVEPGELSATKAVPELAERLRAVASAIETAQSEVRQMNKVQAGLLRRSRRSVNVLVNFLSNYSETYKPPVPVRTERPAASAPAPVAARAGA